MSGLSSSIQFRDIDSVAEAFKNRGVEAWSINCGKQFMFKGVGIDAFEAVLITLDSGDSSATYTVKVYEDVTDAKNIKSNTPDDGSFNFKLNEQLHETYRQIKGFSPGRSNLQTSKESAIMQKLEEMEARLNESEPVDNGLGLVGKLLDHPVIAGIAPTIIELFVNAITGTKPPVNQEMSRYNPPAVLQARNAVLNGINEDRIIAEAIEKLKQFDPNLAGHLQKLVLIAEQDNKTFNLIISSLD